MIFHADIPNGDYIESLTIEAYSFQDACATAREYIFKAFGKVQGPSLFSAWNSLCVPVKEGIVHFAHRKDEDSDY